ncbi:sulfatase-like hydrolase/transferase [Akkermansiaceae bacterium]|nr:sulfatase-like hydrolase/transferase [Akkermansiaceae bacterium]MDA7888457.1 sulfatase-like hydrolase/transferase [Akkermansiaceae bacterium]MDB4537625.1 sulfatase-like hydrolase/transferase [Akkermansiaceae bacterium]MDB4544752.1 sulfatase-like hydrolase/transferase [Akkermansiaceae bacterium]
MKIALALLLSSGLCFGDTYFWTAGGDGASIFQEANWTLSGGGVIPQIDPVTPVNHDLVVNSGTPGGGGGGGNTLDLGTGSLTVNGGTFRMSVGNSAGITGGPLTVTNGTVIAQFISASSVSLSGGSLDLNGGTNPLNGVTVDFSSGSPAILLFRNETPADVLSEHLGKITVNGASAVASGGGQNLSVISDGGSGSRVEVFSSVDSDSDGIADGSETIWFGDLDQDETTDFDGDGLLDIAEINTHGTNPTSSDSDGDGLIDGDELNNRGTNPLALDSDSDGSPDGLEIEKGTDPQNAAASVSRPNIIFFFVDDLGYGDVGCFWQDQKTGTQKFDTPGIDRMAAEGAKMTHHYISAPVCAPSRASLLNGRHQGHSNVRDSQFDKTLENNHTMASVLQKAGYRTIHTGKAGLAGGEGSTNLAGTGSSNLGAHPLDRGYDEFFGYLFHSDGHEHYPRNGTSDKSAHIYNGYQQVTNASVDLYTTDAWTAYAKKAIIEEVEDGDDQPFFLYLAYETPHFKMQRPAVAYPTINNDGDPRTGGIQWTTATDGNGNVRYASTADGTGSIDGYNHPDNLGSWPTSNQQHVGMIRRMDNSIADIIQTLKDLNIDDNTLCVFSSDNGPHNEGNNPRYFQSFANMEGIKRDMWEAGIRVPTVVRWPGNIAGATGSEANIHEISYPSAIWDWMPTFAEMAGVAPPSWCDGVSLLPTLTGNGTQRDKGYLYFEFQTGGSTPNWAEFPNHRGDVKGEMQCIRVGDLMGIRTGITGAADNFEIYDVTTDPGQATNLAASQTAMQTQMKAMALQGRRPGAGVSRPYDSAHLPPVVTGVEPGLSYSAYEGFFQWVPEFRDLTSVATGTDSWFDVNGHVSRSGNVGLMYTGYLQVPTTGAYLFSLTSDSGANLFIHDAHVIDDDFNHDGSEQSASINLEAGLHPFRLYYTHLASTAELDLQWSGPGFSKKPVVAADLFREAPLSPDPKANNDDATTEVGMPVLIDVLANDLDDGLPSPLSLVSVTQALAGTTSIVGGQINYVPKANFLGGDQFSYTVTDGNTTDTGVVTVSVTYQDPNLLWMPFNQCEGLSTRSASSGTSASLVGFADSASHWVESLQAPGSHGRAISFNGTTSYVVVESGYVPPSGSEDRTITAWIKATADGAIVAWGPKVGGEKWHWRLEGGQMRIEVEGGFKKANTDLRDNQWHHVALVFDGDANPTVNDCVMYLDGVEDGPYTVTDQTINTGVTPVEIGKDGQSRFFGGVIDEVRIYRSALSVAEVQAEVGATFLPSSAWHKGFFADDTPTNAEWLLDDDGDGLSRLAEFALGSNPHLADASEASPSFTLNPTTGKIEVSFNRRQLATHNLVYEVEASNDLIDWDILGTSGIASGVHPVLDCFDQVTFETDQSVSDEPRQFTRLSIQLVP